MGEEAFFPLKKILAFSFLFFPQLLLFFSSLGATVPQIFAHCGFQTHEKLL